MKIGLGTVQFGLNYGISNEAGRPSLKRAGEILSVARQSGIGLLDTAPAYGESESVIGELESQSDSAFKVVTKTPPSQDPAELERVFDRSLERLKRQSVYGLMIHRAEDLLSPAGDALFAKMQELQAKRKVQKIGVSVYDSEQIDAVLSRYPIGLVQVPVNVADQRLIQSGHLRKLKSLGVEVHARSVFLQGLLLMDLDRIPAYFERMKTSLRAFRSQIEVDGLNPLQACLAFVSALEEVDQVICGVNSAAELSEIVAASGSLTKDMKLDFGCAAVREVKFLNPAFWPKKEGK